MMKMVPRSLAASSWMTGSSDVVGLYRTRSMIWSGFSFLVLTLSKVRSYSDRKPYSELQNVRSQRV